MFGHNDPAQGSGNDPAMLDNVKQLASQPANQVEPPQQPQPPAPPQQPQQQPIPQPPVQAHPQPMQNLQPAPGMTAQTAHAEPAQGFSSAPPPPQQPQSTFPPAPNDPTTGQLVEAPTVNNHSNTSPVMTSHSAPTGGSTPAMSPTHSPAQSNTVVQPPTENRFDSGGGVKVQDLPADEPPSAPADPTQLAGMKKQALDHLEPLVDHLDQSAEEEFKTTMMMIQANDNHSLLDKALIAAKKIPDDKVRAQAMLDIINEINYFATQNNSTS